MDANQLSGLQCYHTYSHYSDYPDEDISKFGYNKDFSSKKNFALISSSGIRIV